MSVLNIDTRFVEISYEISALGRYLDMLEQQLQILIKQEHAQADARLIEIQKNFDEVEWQMVHQEFNELVDELLPRFFRCPFWVMLWATYESGVIHISKYIQNKKRLSLSISDIKGASFLKKANKYFQHVIKFSLFTDKNRRPTRHVKNIEKHYCTLQW